MVIHKNLFLQNSKSLNEKKKKMLKEKRTLGNRLYMAFRAITLVKQTRTIEILNVLLTGLLEKVTRSRDGEGGHV